MTVQLFINTILSTINAMAAGETPSPEDSALAQTFLNAWIGALNAAVAKSMAGTYDPALYTFNAVAQTVNLSDAFAAPLNWYRALTFNTALDLTEPFGKPASQGLVTIAMQSRAEIVSGQAPQPTS